MMSCWVLDLAGIAAGFHKQAGIRRLRVLWRRGSKHATGGSVKPGVIPLLIVLSNRSFPSFA